MSRYQELAELLCPLVKGSETYRLISLASLFSDASSVFSTSSASVRAAAERFSRVYTRALQRRRGLVDHFERRIADIREFGRVVRRIWAKQQQDYGGDGSEPAGAVEEPSQHFPRQPLSGRRPQGLPIEE